MKIEGNKKEIYILNLEFKDSHEASTFQAIMHATMQKQDNVLVEYREDAKKMAIDLHSSCFNLWCK